MQRKALPVKLRTILTIAFSLAAVACANVVAAAAPSGPSDTICPRAVPKIVAFTDAVATNDAAKIAAAARAAADAYQLCAADAQSSVNVAIEPTVNYDKTRQAQYLVVAGKALLASGNDSDGVSTLKTARKLADDVAGWQPSSMAFNSTNHAGHATGDAGGPADASSTQRNTDRNGSRYKGAAIEIRDAADAALIRPQAAQPAASPKPN
jgi:hypothetical protein